MTDTLDKTYDPSAIETRWYAFWASQGHFAPSGEATPSEAERVQRLLSVQNRDRFEQLVGASSLVFLDEAQAIPEVVKRLQFLVDAFLHLTVVATGSSSLDLNASVGEPLTGRQVTHELFPFSMAELVAYEGRFTVIKVYDEVRLRSGY